MYVSKALNPTARHTIFSVVIGGFFYWASLLCTNQASVQKCMSLKCRKKAFTALTISIIGKSTQKVIKCYDTNTHKKVARLNWLLFSNGRFTTTILNFTADSR